MGRFTRSFTDWQRYRLKQFSLGFLRFAATVLCSALTAVWLLERHPDLFSARGRRPGSTAPVTAAGRPAPAINSSRQPRTMGDNYTRYFDEALPILRADPNVRMIKVDMPSTILGYQEAQAAAKDGAAFRLQAAGRRIPVLAVSRSAQEFLRRMKLTYVDPRTVPNDVLKDSAPVNGAALQGFLLVPDVSTEHAAKFVFSRR